MSYVHYSYYNDSENVFISMVNVRIRFNDNVRINAFGLDAKLHGTLLIICDKNGLGLKRYVDIFVGDFNVYAQSLLIKRG